MRKLFVIMLTLAAIGCIAGTADAKRWWGGPSTGNGPPGFPAVLNGTHDSSLAAATMQELRHFHAYRGALWYANPDDGGVKTWKHPIPGDTLTIPGLIITGFDTKPTTFGVWAQAPGGGPYSGCLVFTGANESSSLLGLVVGDIVTITGVTSEFQQSSALPYTVTELNTGLGQSSTFPLAIQKTGHTSTPVPQKLHPGNIAQGGGVNAPGFADVYGDSNCAEQWEGCLVRLDSVYVQRRYITNGSGVTIFEANLREWVNRGTGCRLAVDDTCRIDDKLLFTNTADSTTCPWDWNDSLKYVVGIVSQEFGAYKLWPRNWLDGNDVGLKSPQPPDLVVAYAIDNTHVFAKFNARMDDTTTQNAGNYSLNAPVTISAAVLAPDSLGVTLTTSAMTPASAQELLVAGVKTSGFPHATMQGVQSQKFRGGITPINFLQTPKAPGLPTQDSSQVTNEIVTVRGIVTANLGNGEVYVQDNSGAIYQGMEIFGSPVVLAEGDDATVAGLVVEFTPSGAPSPKTEYNPVYYVKKNSSGNAVPTPVAVSVADVSNVNDGGNGNAEKYESVLIQASGYVYADTCSLPNRDWWLRHGAGPAGTDSAGVGQISTYDYIACPGDNVSVIGILGLYGPATHISAGYRIEPRKTLDVYNSNSAGVGGAKVQFSLKQSRPNPFSRSTEIRYSLSRAGATSLKIYNVSGRAIRTLVSGESKAGEFTASWDGRDQAGHVVGSGIYYYRLTQGGQTLTRKLAISR